MRRTCRARPPRRPRPRRWLPRRPIPRRPVADRADLEAVARQLGREPRGVLAVAYRCADGQPGVVKTAPKLPDGTPFPTLYYLTHPVLTAAASRLETTGMMREMTERLQQDSQLAAAYRRGAQGYLARRGGGGPPGGPVFRGGVAPRGPGG